MTAPKMPRAPRAPAPPMADEIADATSLEGADAALEKIRDYLEKLLRGGEHEEALYVLLFHERGGTETELGSYAIGYDETLEDAAAEVLEDASDHAESHRGRSKYLLKVKDRKKGPVCRWSLLVQSGVEPIDLDNYDQEPATPTGFLSQMQRHDEVKTQLFLQGVQQTQGTMTSIVEDLRSQLAQEREENKNMRKEREELRSMQFARDMEVEKFKADEKRRAQVLEALTTAGMMFLQHWAATQGHAATLAGLKEVLGGMTAEQQAALQGVLSPAQQQQFAQVFQAAQKVEAPSGIGAMIGGLMNGALPGAAGA